jgi:hypothetical protein
MKGHLVIPGSVSDLIAFLPDNATSSTTSTTYWMVRHHLLDGDVKKGHYSSQTMWKEYWLDLYQFPPAPLDGLATHAKP